MTTKLITKFTQTSIHLLFIVILASLGYLLSNCKNGAITMISCYYFFFLCVVSYERIEVHEIRRWLHELIFFLFIFPIIHIILFYISFFKIAKESPDEYFYGHLNGVIFLISIILWLVQIIDGLSFVFEKKVTGKKRIIPEEKMWSHI